MKIKRKPNALTKKSRRGFRGYPVATVAFYGPDAKTASKVVVGIVQHEDAEPNPLEKWFSEDGDLRLDEEIIDQIKAFIKQHKVMTVVAPDRIIGCPHEEVVDYPEGKSCPECPYWEGRNRWTGEMEIESKAIS